ncbi:MAG: hypothetical protein FWC93_01855 [Defluviitaleaceae bacterium]|nr:hypothetical protein [Defluviitaleaceae bacterium]
MTDFSKEELVEARQALRSLTGKCEKAFGKLEEGTAQHTLMKKQAGCA